jgi:outer membrane protein assembly factor BamA
MAPGHATAATTYLNPTRGSLNRFNAEVALPGSTREFYKLSYRFRQYWPVGRPHGFCRARRCLLW